MKLGSLGSVVHQRFLTSIYYRFKLNKAVRFMVNNQGMFQK